MPITANSDAYVVRDSRAPLHLSQPVGTVDPANVYTEPVGAAIWLSAPTNAVVASCVERVPVDAVGAVGMPVNAGESSGAHGADILLVPHAIS